MVLISEVEKSYDRVKALNNINIEVGEGELFGLIGPDGAGKSTLFRILTTLLLPDKGRIKVGDLDVVGDFRKVRNVTGYMPGQFSLYSDLTVKENLTFFATVFGTTIQENYDLIKDVYQQIEPFSDRLAGRLSGGMKQKLALSCALIHQPSLLVLDEPTTGVDAVSRREFWELLKILKSKGITILVSTPYMDEAGMCDRVGLIQQGTILKIDSPHKITQSYGKKIYAVKGDNLFRLLQDLREYPGTDMVFTFGQELHYTDKDTKADTGRLNSFLLERKHASLSINEIEPGIEDVFMKLSMEK